MNKKSLYYQHLISSLLTVPIWRARNVPSDSLGLRQPIWITRIRFLRPNMDTVSTGAHICTGTGYRQVRYFMDLSHSFNGPDDVIEFSFVSLFLLYLRCDSMTHETLTRVHP
jgi:hypothetical protein